MKCCKIWFFDWKPNQNQLFLDGFELDLHLKQMFIFVDLDLNSIGFASWIPIKMNYFTGPI